MADPEREEHEEREEKDAKGEKKVIDWKRKQRERKRLTERDCKMKGGGKRGNRD